MSIPTTKAVDFHVTRKMAVDGLVKANSENEKEEMTCEEALRQKPAKLEC